MVFKYLGLNHEYGSFDCLLLIKCIYKNEFGLDFDIPTYTTSRQWMKEFSPNKVDEWAMKSFTKVNWTDSQDYDVIAFKNDNSKLIIHFGLFLKPIRMLHIEEGGVSCVETLSDYWINRVHAVYRHEQMV